MMYLLVGLPAFYLGIGTLAAVLAHKALTLSWSEWWLVTLCWPYSLLDIEEPIQ